MAQPKPTSLRWRVFRLAAVLLLGSATLLIVFINDYANRASDRAFDRLLSASALSISGAVQIEEGAVVLELPAAAFSMVSGQERVFYSVLGPRGSHVTGYPDLATEQPLAVSDVAVFADTVHNGEPVRLVSVGRLVSTDQGTGWVTIRVAETLGAREALANEILKNAIVPVAVLTLLALGLVWVVVGRALAPLAVIDRVLRQRRPDDLSPIEVPVPTEVQRLVGGLNGFMERLGVSTERMAGLVAEAAHQVRNPLASLRAQSELALTETSEDTLRERVARIHDGAVEASHLVSQLLMDATISHRMDAISLQPVSVAALVDEVVDRLDPDLRPRVAVKRERDTDAAVLQGDRVCLREMLRNLLSNALAYSDGQVEIAVSSRGRKAGLQHIGLSVSDRGPGIADSEKDELLKRFVRGTGVDGKIGSGLGLAMACRVIEGHGGRLQLLDRAGGGLEVMVELPLERDIDQKQKVARALISMAVLAVLAFANPMETEAQLYPSRSQQTGQLVIAGTTDTALFANFIDAFQTQNPGIAVHYSEIDSLSLYNGYLADTLEPAPDLLISSAADLQLKLANDGHALRHPSPWLDRLPGWAQWRAEVIGFTYEPAVIIYNPALIPPGSQPRSHRELAELLETEPQRFMRKVATYDIARSGVGYLLASQDQQISSQFWRLAAAFGRVEALLSDSSPEILAGVAAGQLAIGYNVLGSYAFAQQAAGAQIGIVVPDDYVLVLTRSMLIPRKAPNPDLARAFVDFALSPSGQSVAAGPSALGSVMPQSQGSWTQERISAMGQGALQPIALAPVLMVALDPQRRSRFLASWQEIVSPRVPRSAISGR
ncbi:extracellular solute-binding protein (plasmid) [Peteryoungia desertarenae]|uniref:histidine kinase n=1 Tax=Peteryoungia desertarenae TaxID=1813451 RepID=A0ABX6QUJ4_9HYPH|nr:extracellular solute-binding protein [Peteryoungia desertarenae]QLF72001.1 extracellular solute-binding protein [Peteryoungia desertarenae]